VIQLFGKVLSILIKHEYRYFIAVIWSVKKIIFAGTQKRILSALTQVPPYFTACYVTYAVKNPVIYPRNSNILTMLDTVMCNCSINP